MQLLLMAVVGLVAQLIDGSMGMAYGVTSASLLLMAGIAPAAVSASVHIAELVTTALSGVSHWRFGNVHWPLVIAIALPGAAGAFIGAAFLSAIPGHLARPYVATFLFVLGSCILVRYVRQNRTPEPLPSRRLFEPQRAPSSTRPDLSQVAIAALGAVAGFADAVGGGGWGPLTTPVLVARRGADPRKVIGSVDTAEFLVAGAAAAGFLVTGGPGTVAPLWIAALMLGGAVAAPIAARIVSRVPPRFLGVAVGGMVMLTNAPTVLGLLGAQAGLRVAAYGVILVGWLAAGASVWVRWRFENRSTGGGWYRHVDPAT